ncbi:hypothetical protein DDB_G0271152 [Dictyostelium discoideum AX4]|uniref:Uncharacterized protein n=1 Tax=Dictyostelium discoideum TaxID=44689 RepID=Q55B33_DICDI|nr:hypothetical protein DDB_G0271152 [Dictyostelium discoideum AX4]EAL71706.1 hypothetical protein DDB_G0271152 [Dictyostelium discoideum AX4]|eukprot:XP_645779.1 hypothetical protein DDB_G0271152 [Dictyostelium discoideum AX4]
MGTDYIQLNEENSSSHNQNLNNNINDNIYFNNVNTTYTPQIEKKLDSHYDQTFSPQIKPIIAAQYSLETQPPKIVLQSPQYYPPPNVNKTISADDDESHFNSSLIIFIIGFFFSCIWLINIRYLKSKNKNAKTLATASIVLFIISMVLFLILIISSAGASSTYRFQFNNLLIFGFNSEMIHDKNTLKILKFYKCKNLIYDGSDVACGSPTHVNLTPMFNPDMAGQHIESIKIKNRLNIAQIAEPGNQMKIGQF